MGQMTNLRIVKGTLTALTGELPASLANLRKMQEFDLSLNQLGGPLPAIGNWADLKRLLLVGSALTGTLPDEVGNWKSIVEVNLANNRLNGNLPSSIGEWEQVERVFLYGNAFTGELP